MTEERERRTASVRELSPRERYRRDPWFRTLVDVLYHYLDRCEFTGTELREAAILAAQMQSELSLRLAQWYTPEDQICPK